MRVCAKGVGILVRFVSSNKTVSDLYTIFRKGTLRIATHFCAHEAHDVAQA
jgi:hypothetical protein